LNVFLYFHIPVMKFSVHSVPTCLCNNLLFHSPNKCLTLSYALTFNFVVSSTSLDTSSNFIDPTCPSFISKHNNGTWHYQCTKNFVCQSLTKSTHYSRSCYSCTAHIPHKLSTIMPHTCPLHPPYPLPFKLNFQYPLLTHTSS
jgi:hypothetical protein